MDSIDIISYGAFFCIGFFCFFSAMKDADWFMNHRKARFFVDAMGRPKSRILYMVLGLAIAGVGIAGIVAAYNGVTLL